MEKAHLESVLFTDYRILRYTSAKKGFEKLKESSVEDWWSSCRMQSTNVSLCMWFRLPAAKQKQYMQREKVIFILLIGCKYLYIHAFHELVENNWYLLAEAL